MLKSRSLTRFFFAAGLAVIFAISFSSCGHKEGCPNKITEVAGVPVDTNA